MKVIIKKMIMTVRVPITRNKIKYTYLPNSLHYAQLSLLARKYFEPSIPLKSQNSHRNPSVPFRQEKPSYLDVSLRQLFG
jgi:hypothetical protein